MPKGVFKRTEQHILNLSLSLKGRKAWNKGLRVIIKNGKKMWTN